MTARHQADKKKKKKTKKKKGGANPGQSAHHDRQAANWPAVTSYPEAVFREVSVPSCSVFPFPKPPRTVSAVWRRNCNYLLNWVADRYVLGFAPATGISPEPDSVQTLQKSFRWNCSSTEVPPCVYAYEKILWSMSEFGGVWKHQNNPACTKSV